MTSLIRYVGLAGIVLLAFVLAFLGARVLLRSAYSWARWKDSRSRDRALYVPLAAAAASHAGAQYGVIAGPRLRRISEESDEGHPNLGQPGSLEYRHPNLGQPGSLEYRHPDLGQPGSLEYCHPDLGQPGSLEYRHPDLGQPGSLEATVVTAPSLASPSWPDPAALTAPSPLEVQLRHGWLLLAGHALAWLPFAAVDRVAFLYHYIPALLFSLLAAGLVFDVLTQRAAAFALPRGFTGRDLTAALLLTLALASFLYFLPLYLGWPIEPGDGVHRMRRLDVWNES